MKANLGMADRIVRLLLGLLIAGIGIGLRTWWGLVAIVPLATAALSWCPVYLPFKLSTRPHKVKPTA